MVYTKRLPIQAAIWIYPPLAKILVQLEGGYDIDILANNLTFEVEPFNKQKYSEYVSRDEASLAPPLVNYEYMACFLPK